MRPADLVAREKTLGAVYRRWVDVFDGAEETVQAFAQAGDNSGETWLGVTAGAGTLFLDCRIRRRANYANAVVGVVRDVQNERGWRCARMVTRAARMENTLQGGKSEDASYRVHLYRSENVPLTVVFDFAIMFFRSSRLVEQWLNDMRRYTEKNETV